MKLNRLFSMMIVAITLSLSTTAFAQQDMGKPNKPHGNAEQSSMPKECMGAGAHEREMDFDYLKLTDDQKGKVKDLKLAQQKESMKNRNKMEELHAHLRTLSTADVADMKAINATIDEITQTQNLLMKSREGFKQQLRALLTDEQRLQFDLKQGRNSLHGEKRMHKHPDDKNE